VGGYICLSVTGVHLTVGDTWGWYHKQSFWEKMDPDLEKKKSSLFRPILFPIQVFVHGSGEKRKGTSNTTPTDMDYRECGCMCDGGGKFFHHYRTLLQNGVDGVTFTIIQSITHRLCS
jgi:hypothetical protein